MQQQAVLPPNFRLWTSADVALAINQLDLTAAFKGSLRRLQMTGADLADIELDRDSLAARFPGGNFGDVAQFKAWLARLRSAEDRLFLLYSI